MADQPRKPRRRVLARMALNLLVQAAIRECDDQRIYASTNFLKAQEAAERLEEMAETLESNFDPTSDTELERLYTEAEQESHREGFFTTLGELLSEGNYQQARAYHIDGTRTEYISNTMIANCPHLQHLFYYRFRGI